MQILRFALCFDYTGSRMVKTTERADVWVESRLESLIDCNDQIFVFRVYTLEGQRPRRIVHTAAIILLHLTTRIVNGAESSRLCSVWCQAC